MKMDIDLLEHIVAIAREAGAAIMAIYGTHFSVCYPCDGCRRIGSS